jgi:tetratricopeptide (TPR) repeat protein
MDSNDRDPLTESEDAYATALAFVKRRQWGEAITWFERAASAQPMSLAVHLEWGEALVKALRFKDAVDVFDRMSVACGDAVEKALCLYLKAGAQVCDGEFGEALAELDRALLFRPKFWEARGLRAYAMAMTGQHAAAKEEFEQVLAAHPEYFDRWPVAFEGAFLISLSDLRTAYEQSVKLAGPAA